MKTYNNWRNMNTYYIFVCKKFLLSLLSFMCDHFIMVITYLSFSKDFTFYRYKLKYIQVIEYDNVYISFTIIRESMKRSSR